MQGRTLSLRKRDLYQNGRFRPDILSERKSKNKVGDTTKLKREGVDVALPRRALNF